MPRVVLVLATMALAILLAGGVAQATIINGEPDRGANAHPCVGAYVAKVGGNSYPCARGPSSLPESSLPRGIARNSR